MQTSTLFGAKNFGFLKFMVCPHGQGGRGLSQCGHFSNKGEGSSCSDFVRTSLITAFFQKIRIFRHILVQISALQTLKVC